MNTNEIYPFRVLKLRWPSFTTQQKKAVFSFGVSTRGPGSRRLYPNRQSARFSPFPNSSSGQAQTEAIEAILAPVSLVKEREQTKVDAPRGEKVLEAAAKVDKKYEEEEAEREAKKEKEIAKTIFDS